MLLRLNQKRLERKMMIQPRWFKKVMSHKMSQKWLRKLPINRNANMSTKKK